MSLFIPDASPDYVPKLHLVKEWLIEFDDNGAPGREIGLGADGAPLFCGPGEVNYGFWLDTNMVFSEFEGTEIDVVDFEELWSRISSGRTL